MAGAGGRSTAGARQEQAINLCRSWAPYGVTIVPIFTTSKSDPLSVFNWFNSSSLQRMSGAPLKYQLEPLSAKIIPYFFIARRITCIAGVKPEISNDAFKRTFIPIGGRFTLVFVLAQWRAGET